MHEVWRDVKFRLETATARCFLCRGSSSGRMSKYCSRMLSRIFPKFSRPYRPIWISFQERSCSARAEVRLEVILLMSGPGLACFIPVRPGRRARLGARGNACRLVVGAAILLLSSLLLSTPFSSNISSPHLSATLSQSTRLTKSWKISS